ncbi:MAG: hypothetical protein Fur0043_15740 [Anaerolineales bacterium]
MKDWMMKFFETLAGKLTAILAFAVLVILLLALLGVHIPAEYRPLVYIVAILAMVIFALQVVLRRRPVKGGSRPQEPEKGAPDPDARQKYLQAVIETTPACRTATTSPPARTSGTATSVFVWFP